MLPPPSTAEERTCGASFAMGQLEHDQYAGPM